MSLEFWRPFDLQGKRVTVEYPSRDIWGLSKPVGGGLQASDRKGIKVAVNQESAETKTGMVCEIII